jgi:uncharacterized protein with PIN domain
MRYLRMLGFDTLYDRRWSDTEIIDRALADRRIILTRDRGILKQTRVTHGYWVRSHQPIAQLREVFEALHLDGQARPFSRCMACNGAIAPADRNAIRPAIDENIWRRFSEFRHCRQCGKIYWKGTHYKRMRALVERLRSEKGSGS